MSSSPSSRDEILANFQACTGIEDYGEAFTYLDSCNWDLYKAIAKANPDEHREQADFSLLNDRGSPASLISPSAFTAPIFETIGARNLVSAPEETPVSLPNTSIRRDTAEGGSTSMEQPVSIASTSKSQPEVLDVNIQILSDGATDGNSFPLELPGSTTVGELQTLLHQLVGIPPCSQVLEGFVEPVQPQTVITRDLLPKNMSLSLNAGAASSFNQFERHNGSVSDECTLLIHDEKNGKDFSLPYPTSKLITDIKTDVFHVTMIPSRHQVWTGWPSEVGENSTLASLGISREHHLTVASHIPIPAERTPKTHRKPARVGDASEDNSSADEFEDASELLPEDDFLIMCDVPASQATQALIPPNVEDETAGVVHFVEEFQNRYGGNRVPLFYHGTLEAALKDSVMLPAKHRKLLCVYLHHDKSVLANVFCSQSLCHSSIVDYLSNNFVVWGWDLTHESNKSMLLNLISSHFGLIASTTVRSYSLEKLPALLIINRVRGAIEILSVIHGNAILDEVMTSLLHATEIFEDQRRAEAQEEDLREQRETMMAEQDAAYRASLEVDRAKAEAKRKAELNERVEKQRQQSIKEHEDAIKQAVRASLEMDLPAEPGPDCKEPTCVLRFREPMGDYFSRTFTRSTQLMTVMNFLSVKGYPPDEYKYIRSWPRRCITSLDSSDTLEKVQMPQQETINIEERTDDMD